MLGNKNTNMRKSVFPSETCDSMEKMETIKKNFIANDLETERGCHELTLSLEVSSLHLQINRLFEGRGT